MKSPKFSLTEANVPSLFKSALISMGGILLALSFLFLIEYLLPTSDFSAVRTAITTGIAAFLINLIKEFVEEK